MVKVNLMENGVIAHNNLKDIKNKFNKSINNFNKIKK